MNYIQGRTSTFSRRNLSLIFSSRKSFQRNDGELSLSKAASCGLEITRKIHCKIFKNINFEEHLQMVTSGIFFFCFVNSGNYFVIKSIRML